MRRFFDRWYGDHCPPWTWPITSLAISALMIWGVPLLLNGHL